ncbi:sugar nucleotide-binding protein, partial [Stutzerimonas frequens]
RVILAVLKQLDCQAPLWGTYHYGGHEASTPLLVAQALLGEAARYRDVTTAKLTPVAHADCSDAAAEPQHGVLACKKIFTTFGIKPRAWRTGLPSLLERYYRHG